MIVYCKKLELLKDKHKEIWIQTHTPQENIKYFSSSYLNNQQKRRENFYNKIRNNDSKNNNSNIVVRNFAFVVDNQVIGFSSYYSGSNPRIISFSFIINHQFKGQGYGKKLLQLIIDQIKKDIKKKILPSTVEIIEAQIDVRNIASYKIVEKLNFKKVMKSVYCKGIVSNIYRRNIFTTKK